MTPSPRHTLIGMALLLAMGAQAESPLQEPTVTYTVQKGDKLIAIASKVLADPAQWSEVAHWNKMAKPNAISVGQKIEIPLRLMQWAPSQARLISANGDVQINGKAAANGATINEGDGLQAGANSSAVIALEDGSRIQLMPKSLAELVQHRQYGLKEQADQTHWFAGLLRLTTGAVEAIVTPGVKRASPLKITTPTSIVGVRGTHFRVAFGAQARSEVIEGLVVAENPAQAASADLPAGTGAVIRPEEKEIQVKKLLAAPDLSAAPAQLQQSHTWRWPSAPGAKAWRVQLAGDAQFSRIVYEEKLAAPSWPMAGLPLGQWFARVRAIDDVGLEGFDASKHIEILATVLPDWSLRSSSLIWRNNLTALRWTPIESKDHTGGQWRAEVVKEGVVVPSTSVYSGAGALTEYLQLSPGAYTVHIDGQDAQGTPFKRQTFRMQAPEGWGSSPTEVANPLQRFE